MMSSYVEALQSIKRSSLFNFTPDEVAFCLDMNVSIYKLYIRITYIIDKRLSLLRLLFYTFLIVRSKTKSFK